MGLLPLPTIDPVSLLGAPGLHWGLIGPGTIAGDFTRAIHRHTRQRITRVASRDTARAQAFIQRIGIDALPGTVEQLLADPDIDVVYISTPHAQHRDDALRAIAAGKHVLVEKPLALDAAGARDISAAATAAGVFAMEAMWTAFLPRSEAIRLLIADGALGEIRQVEASFGGRADPTEEPRLWDPTVGGGALLDIGVYPIALAVSLLGVPQSVTARGRVSSEGVDARVRLLLDYAGGAGATLMTALDTVMDNRAVIAGEHALVTLDQEFYAPGGFEFRTEQDRVRWEDPSGIRGRDGLAYQAAAVAAAVLDGRLQAAQHPLTAAVAALDVIDEALRQLRLEAGLSA
ncbi:MAG: Gfo/Idh/MocA family oxidoreductase [Actinobacteria bacterium]|nr:Gfo/Idh/MocA family oxidoreductase [Actinomycetota bacterium]